MLRTTEGPCIYRCLLRPAARDYPIHGEQPYMAGMPPKWPQDCQQGQWVLFLDELTTCPPAVQAALLGVIAENRVGDATLPDTV